MSTSNVLRVEIETKESVSTGSVPATSGRPGEGLTPWEQRSTSGMIEQRRKAMERQREEGERLEARRLKAIIDGQKMLEGMRADREKAEKEAEKKKIEAAAEDIARQKRVADVLSSLAKQRIEEEKASSNRRAADVHRQREEAEQKQGGLHGLLARFVPGGGQITQAMKAFGGTKPQQFVGKDVLPVEGTQLARPVAAAAGEAGGLAGLGSAAMAAAGPVAAAVAISVVAAKALGGAMDTARAGVSKFGDSARRLADDDVVGQFEAEVEGFANTMDKIPGNVAGPAARLLAAPILEFKKTVDAYIARGQQIGQYSGPASAAMANAEVRTIRADLREAEQMGAGYAKLIDSQSRLEGTVRELLLPIKSFLLDSLATVLDGIATKAEANKDTFKSVGENLLRIMGPIGQGLLALREAQAEQRREQRARGIIEELKEFDAALNDLSMFPDANGNVGGNAYNAATLAPFGRAENTPLGLGGGL